MKVLRPLSNSKGQFSSLAHSSLTNLLNSERLPTLVRSPLMNLLHSKRLKILVISCRPSPHFSPVLSSHPGAPPLRQPGHQPQIVQATPHPLHLARAA